MHFFWLLPEQITLDNVSSLVSTYKIVYKDTMW